MGLTLDEYLLMANSSFSVYKEEMAKELSIKTNIPETDLFVTEFTGSMLANDVQAFVCYIPTRKCVIVSFRGTESISDWITDLKAYFINFRGVVSVHAGFCKALIDGHPCPYDVVKGCLHEVISKIDGIDDCGDLKIYVTGHSLGGALAVLFSLAFIKEQLAERNGKSKNDSLNKKIKKVYAVTFGQPKIGDESVSRVYKEVNNLDLIEIYQFVYRRDLVARLPIGLVYNYVFGPGTIIVSKDDEHGEANQLAIMSPEEFAKDRKWVRRVSDHFMQNYVTWLKAAVDLESRKALKDSAVEEQARQ